uniref:Uncharacterized protein n=1 Tax=Trichuris muris TaxID=70415 RepID=A0A5S6Q4Z6_TRIMR
MTVKHRKCRRNFVAPRVDFPVLAEYWYRQEARKKHFCPCCSARCHSFRGHLCFSSEHVTANDRRQATSARGFLRQHLRYHPKFASFAAGSSTQGGML